MTQCIHNSNHYCIVLILYNRPQKECDSYVKKKRNTNKAKKQYSTFYNHSQSLEKLGTICYVHLPAVYPKCGNFKLQQHRKREATKKIYNYIYLVIISYTLGCTVSV